MMRTFRRNLNLKSTAHRARKYQKAPERHSFAAYLILKAAFIRFFERKNVILQAEKQLLLLMQYHNTTAAGLYDPANEHDACGVGMVVNVHGGKSHELVDNALRILELQEAFKFFIV